MPTKYPRIICTTLAWLLLLGAALLALPALAQAQTQTLAQQQQRYQALLEPLTPGTQPQAQAIWEKGIVAKGGRQNLEAVQSLLESGTRQATADKGRQRTIRVSLFVFPYKVWSWTDYRPTKLGLYSGMVNYENLTQYTNTSSTQAKELSPQPYFPYATWPGALASTQILYLLESKWVKPSPLATWPSERAGRAVDVVQTGYDGLRYDLAFDRQTHLPLSWTSYYVGQGPRGEQQVFPTTIYLLNYQEVKGVLVPQKLEYENGDGMKYDHSEVKLNVDYDESIFTTPTKIADGPTAWQKKPAQP